MCSGSGWEGVRHCGRAPSWATCPWRKGEWPCHTTRRGSTEGPSPRRKSWVHRSSSAKKKDQKQSYRKSDKKHSNKCSINDVISTVLKGTVQHQRNQNPPSSLITGSPRQILRRTPGGRTTPRPLLHVAGPIIESQRQYQLHNQASGASTEGYQDQDAL